MDWDDYRYFSAVARHGSVRGAAEDLGVNPSTVTRRLDHLERRLGVLLFTRSQTGLHITTEGVTVAQRIDQVAHQLNGLETSLKGRDQRLEGTIRLLVPDVLALHFLLADLAPFLEMYPDIDVQLLPGFQDMNLSHGEVDVVVRATDSPPEMMVGRRLTPVALAAYASRQYARDHDLAAPAGLSWVDWIETGEVMSLYATLRDRYFGGVRVSFRCDQIPMQHAALRAHMGVGILPCLVGDADPDLVRAPQMAPQMSPMLWLLTHPDLRSARRVQVFLEYLREVFVNHEPELLGETIGAD